MRLPFDDDDRARIFHIYNDLYKENAQLAHSELLICCKNISKDVIFEKYFMSLFEQGGGNTEPIKKSQKYANIYREQLKNGKSKTYAHQLAELLADGDFTAIYCKEYVKAYHNCIKENRSQNYAEVYSSKYASIIVDFGGQAEGDEAFDFNIEKLNAYMNAWEYSNKNKLIDSEYFMRLYETNHLNTYYSDNLNLSIEEIDKLVLKNTLEKYHSIKK
jgi:hypothetical protein